jgi:Flp pilus assembly pilin Flp
MIGADRQTFFIDECGSTTVDYTVLAAAVVGLGVLASTVVQLGVQDLSFYIEDQLTDMVETESGDFSAYELLHPNHGNSWRERLAERVSRFSDNRLSRAYNNTYTRATDESRSLNYRRNHTDRLGVILTEMNARGMEVPEGHRDFDEIYQELLAAG